MEDAVNSYSNPGSSLYSADLAQVVLKIKKLYKELGGDVDLTPVMNATNTKVSATLKRNSSKAVADDSTLEPVSVPNDIATFGLAEANRGECSIVTADDLIKFVAAMAEKMGEFFDGYYDAFVKEYGPLSAKSSEETQQRFQIGMMQLGRE